LILQAQGGALYGEQTVIPLQKALFIRQNATNDYFFNSLQDCANNRSLVPLSARIFIHPIGFLGVKSIFSPGGASMFPSLDYNMRDHEKTMKKKATIITNGTEITITRTAKKTAVLPCQDRGFFGSGKAVNTDARPLKTHKISPTLAKTDIILSIAMPACDNDPGNIGSSGPLLSQFQLSAIKGIISQIKPKSILSQARFWALSLSGVSMFSSSPLCFKLWV
jgi:hypothetical protein